MVLEMAVDAALWERETWESWGFFICFFKKLEAFLFFFKRLSKIELISGRKKSSSFFVGFLYCIATLGGFVVLSNFIFLEFLRKPIN